jgi:sigma-E factor negative regulatory protein RseA
MKQKISMLMDGELSNEDAEILLGKIRQVPEIRQDWLNYHLIGDALRQPDGFAKEMSAAFFERLHAEPTVLAPQSRRRDKTEFFAMSAVASIMAMAFLAWISASIDTQPLPQQARQGVMAAVSDNSSVNDNMNAYLLAHHEFSPGADVRGAASYIRTVALKSPVAEK